MERFTRCDSDVSKSVKTISNPRKLKFFPTPHAPVYFDGTNAVNENGKIVNGCLNSPVTAEKIVINHYHVKSYEEYRKKVSRGNADHFDNRYKLEQSKERDRNEIFNDGILNYVDSRPDALTGTGGG